MGRCACSFFFTLPRSSEGDPDLRLVHQAITRPAGAWSMGKGKTTAANDWGATLTHRAPLHRRLRLGKEL